MLTVSRTAITVVGIAAVLLGAGGCRGVQRARLDFSTTEKVKITDVWVDGGSGSVTLRSGADGEVRIDRVVRYQGPEPGKTYRIDGTALHVDTDCGNRCGVDYVIHTPKGVAIHGQTDSGDLTLVDVSTVDVRVGSGRVTVTDATGAVKVVADSGDINLSGIGGDVNAEVDSGRIEARRLNGAVNRFTIDSGDADVTLVRQADVNIDVNSGEVTLRVPAGQYRVDAHANSGKVDVTVPNDPLAKNLLKVSADSGDVTVRVA